MAEKQTVLKRKDGLFVVYGGVKERPYMSFCLCHMCIKSEELSPLKICPTLAKLWGISATDRVIVSVSECSSFSPNSDADVMEAGG